MHSRRSGSWQARRGDPGAWAALDEALALAERIGEPQRLVPVRTARAEAVWLAGDFKRVASEAAALYEAAMNRWHGRDADEAVFWLWRAGTLTPTYPEPAPRFARQIAGDRAGAAELWRRAGCPYEQACALADGDEVASLRQALSIAQNLGARPLAGRIAGRLRDFGARPASPRPKASPPMAAGPLSSLSKREREPAGCPPLLIYDAPRDGARSEWGRTFDRTCLPRSFIRASCRSPRPSKVAPSSTAI